MGGIGSVCMEEPQRGCGTIRVERLCTRVRRHSRGRTPSARPSFGGELGFRAAAYQEVHLTRSVAGQTHAGAVTTSPLLLGVCGGAGGGRQQFYHAHGLNPHCQEVFSGLPEELLQQCQRLARARLAPLDDADCPREAYGGPLALLHDAYRNTGAAGSTTILLAMLDNTSRIHGNLRPMLAVLSLGDCGLLLLRRPDSPRSKLELVFCTELRHPAWVTPRLFREPIGAEGAGGASIPEFTEASIEEKSVVRCVTVLEGDVVLIGSNAIFESFVPDELVRLCNDVLDQGRPCQLQSPIADQTEKWSEPSDGCALLRELAHNVVFSAHAKVAPVERMLQAPGRGTRDDISVVVGEVQTLEQAVAALSPGSRPLASGAQLDMPNAAQATDRAALNPGYDLITE
mmetsp:Transcript_43154/g.119352  ORF Transcript_43154/g.119352 Transcript_43154/m.119352 type:complete len:400 (-) Transcript_43154:4-1203(-)